MFSSHVRERETSSCRIQVDLQVCGEALKYKKTKAGKAFRVATSQTLVVIFTQTDRPEQDKLVSALELEETRKRKRRQLKSLDALFLNAIAAKANERARQ